MSSVAERSVEELVVAIRAHDDPRAREQLLVELIPLVRTLAARYAGRGEPLDDLVQVGCIGLIKALDRFDPDHGARFTSYAIPTIVGEIRRHFRDKTWALHIPRRIKELSIRLNRIVDELTSELGRSPTVAELALRTGESEEHVIEALDCTIAYSTRSLDAPLDGGEDTLAHVVGGVESGFELIEDATLVDEGLTALDERSRRIVEMRFFQEMTQSQIAAELDISQMHVSRLLRRALEDMRGRLDDPEEPG